MKSATPTTRETMTTIQDHANANRARHLALPRAERLRREMKWGMSPGVFDLHFVRGLVIAAGGDPWPKTHHPWIHETDEREFVGVAKTLIATYRPQDAWLATREMWQLRGWRGFWERAPGPGLCFRTIAVGLDRPLETVHHWDLQEIEPHLAKSSPLEGC